MDRIRELFSRLTDLTAEELAELTDLVFAEYDTVAGQDPTAEQVGAISELADIATAIRGEESNRAEQAAELSRQADEARARMEAARNPEEAAEGAEEVVAGEGEGEGATAEETEAETVTEPEPGTAVAEVPEAIAASRGGTGRVARMAAARRPAASPEVRPVEDDHPRAALVAAAGLRSFGAGDMIPDSRTLANAMVDKLRRLDRNGRPSGDHLVAHADWSELYPQERRLGSDPQRNSELIAAVCSVPALLASGGVCLPTNVDYSVPTWATADRPLRDALPGYTADRGGLRFVAPPDIGTAAAQAGGPTGLGGATSVWTEATDASPGNATKPVYVVACGTEETVYVDAVPTRVQFGNMQGRFAPEQIAANTELAVAIAAREAEMNLLTKIAAASKQVLTDQYLGATRDLLTAVDILVEQYRFSHRFPRAIGLNAIFPEWAKGLIRSDMARELAHDNTNGRDVMAISDAQIEDWFSARGVNVIWTLDALGAGTYGTGGHAIGDQNFYVPTAGAKPQWPGQASNAAFVLAWFLFVEGTYQFLDGGRLDLGVVRDSTLDATNDYETFVETFEGIAFRGLEAYQVQSTILPTGGSAGSVASSGYHE